MTPSSTSRKLQCSRLANLRTLLVAAAACAVLVDCSSSNSPSGQATGGSSSTNQGGSSGVGGSGNGGSGLGGSSADGCTSNGGGSVVDIVPNYVGQFSITLTPANLAGSTPTAASTSVGGKVYDAPKPFSPYIWTTQGCQGIINGCQIVTPRTPVCAPACDANSICLSDGKCSPTPKIQDVGTVTVAGFKSQGADATLNMSPLSTANPVYQMLPSFTPDFPPFDDGAPIHFEATGGVYSRFSMDTQGISPVELTGPEIIPVTSDTGEASVTWTPGNSGAHIQVEVTFGVHGGAQSRILCDVEDTGSITIPPSLVKELVSLGSSGAPRVAVTRSRMVTTTIASGTVALDVTSMVMRQISVDGTLTCNTSDECPTGQTCVNLLCTG
jgi:hypothetical protein